jgi:hypothetical protein
LSPKRIYTAEDALARKKASNKRSKAKNWPKHVAKVREWRRNNPAKIMLASIRSSAKKRGLDFNIDLSDIDIPETCPVLGIRLFIRDKQGPGHNSPTLDRVDNTKGYVKGNVKVISHRANSLKRDSYAWELRAVAYWMEVNGCT